MDLKTKVLRLWQANLLIDPVPMIMQGKEGI